MSLRSSLATLIQREFERNGMTVFVEAENLHPAQGRWRSDVRLDVYRWEGMGRWYPNGDLSLNGVTVSIDSWDTMTACVKHGIGITFDKHPCMFEIYAALDD